VTEFDHPALLYGSLDHFLETMVPFVRAGVDNDEVVFVATRADNVDALHDELGTGAGAARLADTDQWYPHPAARLRAFHTFVTRELNAGAVRIRLAGEPVWRPEPPEFVREWQRYESVLNAVLEPFPATLLCLYDASRLDPSVLATAHQTHRTVHLDGQAVASAAFQEPDRLLSLWNPELAPPPPTAVRAHTVTDLAAARTFLAEHALTADVRPDRAMDLSVAANEILTNALIHADGPVALWAWTAEDRFVCQIEDQGPGVADPLAGYRPPPASREGERGLWLARQLVDLLQLVSADTGTAVRLHVRRG
jgi:anti-sigma regulatory factor (Ser/Thr protein kinase)